MNFLRRFMMGRYGTDQLSMSLLILGMIITFLADAVHSQILITLTYVIFLACMFRILSKNISARQSENYKFLKYYNPALAWGKSKFNIAKGSRTYKYFKCPNCKQMMRAPRKKGNIAVTCRKCNTKFNVRT